MNDHGVSRRQANRILLASGLAAAGGLATAAGSLAQPVVPKKEKDKVPPKPPQGAKPAAQANQPPPQPRSWIDGAMRRGKTHDWILKPTVHVQAYQEDPARATGDRPLVIGALTFKTAAVLFPVIRGTASSETDIDNVKSELTFNDRTEDIKADYNESYHAGVRLGRWELRDKTGKEVELKLEIPMTCWEPILDEKKAAEAQWPTGGKWPRMAQSTLAKQARVDLETADSTALKDLLDKWLGGQKPEAIPPFLLAKTLCGKVIETFQPSGNGELYDKLGAFTGLALAGPAETIRTGKGSPHEIASVLLGVYRAAGLPARLVIGYDESENKGNDSSPFSKKRNGGTRVRSWVEFCLVDEFAPPMPPPGSPSAPAPPVPSTAPVVPRELWIPSDPVRIRKRSSQLARIDQPWKFFGTHDELPYVLPFAHHFIPPTTVVAYGYAFWGWFTTPTTQIAEHWLRFQAQTAPKRAKPNPRGQPVKPPTR